MASTAHVGFVDVELCVESVVREAWLYDRTAFVAIERYLGSASDTSGDKMPGNAYSIKRHF
jgi:hypothetical protein